MGWELVITFPPYGVGIRKYPAVRGGDSKLLLPAVRPFFLLLVFTGIFLENLMSEGGGNKSKKDSYSFFKEIFPNVYVGGEIKKIITILKF
jgi:hypothetical protein